jgi:CheY-like chemotaxis protein
MGAKKQRIFVIDDDPDIHLAVKSILQHDFEIECFNNGQSGLAAMRRQPPDLVLLDVMMTTMTEGFHLLYEIRQDSALRHVPVVVVSSIERDTRMNFSNAVGSEYLPADGFLEKPFDAAKLQTIVDEIISRAHAGARAR